MSAEGSAHGGPSEPAVSVILVVRDGAAYITDALESVRRGEVVPCEILVIDGQSTDDTLSIVSRFPGTSIHSQRSSGIAGAYNEGIRLAVGDLVAFISHDDLWTSRKLCAQLEYLSNHPDAWGCVGHVMHFLDRDSVAPAGFRRSLLDRPVPGYVMECLLVRRTVFEHVGLFDESMSVSEDTDWFARVRDAGMSIGLLEETLLLKRVHSGNTSLNDRGINDQLLRVLRGSIERKRSVHGAIEL